VKFSEFCYKMHAGNTSWRRLLEIMYQTGVGKLRTFNMAYKYCLEVFVCVSLRLSYMVLWCCWLGERRCMNKKLRSEILS